jgi:hypothetical protein
MLGCARSAFLLAHAHHSDGRCAAPARVGRGGQQAASACATLAVASEPCNSLLLDAKTRVSPVSTVATARYDDCLSASWLSERLAVDVASIDAMRRAGELIGVRPEGSTEWRYPAWQFSAGKPRPVVARILAAAREAKLDERRLYDVLTLPAGLGGRSDARRLADLVVLGDDDQVVAAVRSASPR